MSKRTTRWQPLVIGRAEGNHKHGMAATFYESGGRVHHYQYRKPQRAVQCLAFYNRLYNGFALEFVDGSMHLDFKRNDRAAVRDWRHFQAIKNEVAGPDREAIEIFPREANLYDGANEYHLWVLPPGQESPLGLAGPAQLGDAINTHDHARYLQIGATGATQRGWEPDIPTGLGQE